MLGGLRLYEGQETFVLLRGTQELEGDPALADRADHCGHLQRRLVRPSGNFQVKNIIDPHVRLALDDTAPHREVEHRPLASDFPSGEGQIQAHGNPEMFATVDRMARIVQPDA